RQTRSFSGSTFFVRLVWLGIGIYAKRTAECRCAHFGASIYPYPERTHHLPSDPGERPASLTYCLLSGEDHGHARHVSNVLCPPDRHSLDHGDYWNNTRRCLPYFGGGCILICTAGNQSLSREQAATDGLCEALRHAAAGVFLHYRLGDWRGHLVLDHNRQSKRNCRAYP